VPLPVPHQPHDICEAHEEHDEYELHEVDAEHADEYVLQTP
jgi:hypothetical protein